MDMERNKIFLDAFRNIPLGAKLNRNPFVSVCLYAFIYVCPRLANNENELKSFARDVAALCRRLALFIYQKPEKMWQL
jgi:hypothetical protein